MAAPSRPDARDTPAPLPRQRWWRRLGAWLSHHETLLWSLHSAWALAFGVGVMWLGARDVRWLRVTYGYIAFIWLSSMALPWLVTRDVLPAGLRAWLQMAVNYFNKNFYQQLLFFVLPLYWASTTFWSPNSWFVALVAVSAVLSTVDVVYDRHLSARRSLNAVFFAFNLFATVNVILPVLWGLRTVTASRVSVALAAFGFLSLRAGAWPVLSSRRRWPVAVAGGALLFALTEYGRPYIPPAPLVLGRTTFGATVLPESLRVPAPIETWTSRDGGRLAVVTAIAAPAGLHDRVRLVWSLDDVVFQRSRSIDVVGGRAAGYRVWSVVMVPASRPGQRLRLELETEGGQLIGRAVLPVR